MISSKYISRNSVTPFIGFFKRSLSVTILAFTVFACGNDIPPVSEFRQTNVENLFNQPTRDVVTNLATTGARLSFEYAFRSDGTSVELYSTWCREDCADSSLVGVRDRGVGGMIFHPHLLFRGGRFAGVLSRADRWIKDPALEEFRSNNSPLWVAPGSFANFINRNILPSLVPRNTPLLTAQETGSSLGESLFSIATLPILLPFAGDALEGSLNNAAIARERQDTVGQRRAMELAFFSLRPGASSNGLPAPSAGPTPERLVRGYRLSPDYSIYLFDILPSSRRRLGKTSPLLMGIRNGRVEWMDGSKRELHKIVSRAICEQLQHPNCSSQLY